MFSYTKIFYRKEEIIIAKENIKKFYEEISKNKELQERFLAAQEYYETEGKGEKEILEDIVLPIAKEAGYEFSVKEYYEASRDIKAENGISEEELENVSGGGGFCLFVGVGNEISAGTSSSNSTGHACIYIGIGIHCWD